MQRIPRSRDGNGLIALAITKLRRQAAGRILRQRIADKGGLPGDCRTAVEQRVILSLCYDKPVARQILIHHEEAAPIPPAADVVSPLWAIVLGAIAGVLTCLACGLKFKLGYDDSLDVVGVHGVGGFTGTVLIGFFGEGTGLFAGGDWRQLVVQLIVALVAIVWSAVITGIIAFALEKTIGWRVTEAQEVGGIDLADQGERAYDFAGTASSVLKEVK